MKPLENSERPRTAEDDIGILRTALDTCKFLRRFMMA